MFGSIVLEVLIGLVLVYVLLSLVCSTIQEFIASRANWRGDMLREAIARLFDEPSPSKGTTGTWTRMIDEHPLVEALRLNKSQPPSYIPNAVFADALIDLMAHDGTAPVPQAPSDRLVRVLRMLNPDARIRATPRLGDKTGRTLSLLMERARQRVDATAPDSVKRTLGAFHEEICAWYENTMNRATGWYRRQTQLVLYVIALGAVTATNADTLMISEQLAVDPKAREAAVVAAAKYVEEHAPSEATGGDRDAGATLKNSVAQLRDTIVATQIEIGWPDPILLEKRIEFGSTAWWLWVLRKVVGLAITLFAVALGAPFWFQMLEKLVKLRTSGTPIPASASATPALPGADDPAAPTPGSGVSVAVGSTAGATSVVAVTSTAVPAGEKLDAFYWQNFAERWKSSRLTQLPPSDAPDADGRISAFLARMAALAYEPAWTIRGRLGELGIPVAAANQFKFCDQNGTQAFAFKLGPDVVVAYRGTEPSKIEDVIADAHFALSKRDPHVGRVHSGFADAIDRVFAELDRWIDENVGGGRVFLTGHSLGAALATLHFDRRVAKTQNDIARHELVTFGSPRVGDDVFRDEFHARVGLVKDQPRRTRVLRFVNNRDLVTRVAPRNMKFEHVGAEIYIDSDGRVHVGEEGGKKWVDFTLLVVDGLVEFKAAAKKPIGDHSMDLYVRRLENWTGWKV